MSDALPDAPFFISVRNRTIQLNRIIEGISLGQLIDVRLLLSKTRVIFVFYLDGLIFTKIFLLLLTEIRPSNISGHR